MCLCVNEWERERDSSKATLLYLTRHIIFKDFLGKIVQMQSLNNKDEKHWMQNFI